MTDTLYSAFEAGFVPAAFYMITVWYKPSEISKRLNIFYSAVIFALAIGGVLAYAMWVPSQPRLYSNLLS